MKKPTPIAAVQRGPIHQSHHNRIRNNRQDQNDRNPGERLQYQVS